MRVNLAGDKWSWYEFGDSEFAAELYIPDTSEYAQMIAELDLASTPNISGRVRYVSEKWFRNFRGLTDQDGSEVENTLENRILLLERYRELWIWVSRKIDGGRQWETEKNGERGAA